MLKAILERLRQKWGTCYWKLMERGSCFKWWKNLAEQYASVLWKVDLGSYEIGNLAEISKQSYWRCSIASPFCLLYRCEMKDINWRSC